MHDHSEERGFCISWQKSYSAAVYSSKLSHTLHTDQPHPEQTTRSHPEAEMAVKQLSDPAAGRTFRSAGSKFGGSHGRFLGVTWKSLIALLSSA